MASKQKRNGCTALRRVREAIRKCGCTDNEFFVQAGIGGNVEAQINKFHLLERYGASGAPPGYGIPRLVLAFADLVHQRGCPDQLFSQVKKQWGAPSYAPT